MNGLDLYDYGARWMDAALGRFTTMDPLCEKYYSISPYAYCGGNPVNMVDPDGRKVKPYGSAELTMIHNTLPSDSRQYVQLDENGFIDESLLKSYQGDSYNFNCLRQLVNNPMTIDVILDDEYTYADSSGNIHSNHMAYVPYDPEHPEDRDIEGVTMDGISTGEMGHRGKTLFPDYLGVENSSNNHLQIIINSNLSPEGAAEVYSHEGNGHGLLYLNNGQDHIGASHHFNNGRDENQKLVDMIIRSKKETIENMRK